MSYGLRYERGKHVGKKRLDLTDEDICKLAVDRLLRHLEESNYVILQREVSSGEG